MKDYIGLILQQASSHMFLIFITFILLLFICIITLYYLQIDQIYLFIKEKNEEAKIFDINLMGEEERKLHILTALNTKLNKETPEKAEYYITKSILSITLVYREIYGTNYKCPPALKRKDKLTTNRVTFSDKNLVMTY